MATITSVRCFEVSEEETRIKPPVSTMVPQLGSSPRIMANAEWDMRLLSYIVTPEKMPSSFKSVLYFLVVRDIVEGGKSYLDSLVDNYLVLVNSIDGRGRNDQIRGENALKGLSVPIELPPEKPGVLDRLMDSEKVQEYERWKERKELGLE